MDKINTFLLVQEVVTLRNTSQKVRKNYCNFSFMSTLKTSRKKSMCGVMWEIRNCLNPASPLCHRADIYKLWYNLCKYVLSTLFILASWNIFVFLGDNITKQSVWLGSTVVKSAKGKLSYKTCKEPFLIIVLDTQEHLISCLLMLQTHTNTFMLSKA